MNLASFSEWWASLSGPEQFFWGIALITSILFVLQFLLSMLGMHGHSDIDGHGAMIEDVDGLNLISIRGILIGLMIFGWTGVAAIAGGQNLIIAAAWALAGGILALVGVAYFMRFFLKMQDGGQSFDLNNALDEIGEVYLRIPPSRSGTGKVHITFSNMYQEVDAVTNSGTEIPTGAKVKVVEITDDRLLRVEPLS